jgi:ribosomal protein S18 acetylase RimI-like enzyme
LTLLSVVITGMMISMPDLVYINPLDAERLDDIAVLWGALYDHHIAVASHITEVSEAVKPKESWRRRRKLYERWLGEPGSFGLLAERAGRPVGYTVVRIEAGGAGQTWERDGKVGVVETLSVLPSARRAGVGGALMAAIKDRLGAAGLSTLELDVVATNADAIRFYERHGLRPALTRMMGRLDVGASS